MGRGRVQLKRIDNKINRQATFSKRRSGLLKKAHEISVLCDAEVALIVLSNRGRLVEYSTDDSMEMILQRYERYSYSSGQLVATNTEAQENLTWEYYKLKSKVKALQRSQRHLMGEDIEALSIKELQSFEQQLDTSQRQIRSRKNQLTNDTITNLKGKEKVLHNEINSLRKKFKKKELVLSLNEQHIQIEESPTVPLLETLPPLNLSGTSQPSGNEGGEEEDGVIIRPRTTKGLIPPWMLGPTNP